MDDAETETAELTTALAKLRLDPGLCPPLVAACAALQAFLRRCDVVHFDGPALSEAGIQLLLKLLLEHDAGVFFVEDEVCLNAQGARDAYADLRVQEVPAHGAPRLSTLVEVKYVRLGYLAGVGAPTTTRVIRRARLAQAHSDVHAPADWAAAAASDTLKSRDADSGKYLGLAHTRDAAVAQLRRYAALVPPGSQCAAVVVVGDRVFLFRVPGAAADGDAEAVAF